MAPAKQNPKVIIGSWLLLLAVAAIVSAVLPISCTDPDAAVKAATDAGYTDVTTTGFRSFAFGCGHLDNFLGGYGFSTGFEGKDSLGRPVSGTVCSGWLPVPPYVHLDRTGSPFTW